LKKYLYLLLSLLLIAILTACGKNSKEEVIEQLENQVDQVETYYTEATVDITMTTPNDDANDHSRASSTSYVNEQTNESSGVLMEDEQRTDYYSTEDTTYAKINDNTWEDMTTQEEKFKSSDTTYPNVAHILIDLKEHEELEMEEQDEKYIFTFAGKSEAVYQAFERPYSLTIEGAAPKDVTQDVQITVDRESYFIENVQNNLSVEIEGHSFEMEIIQTYNQINSIDDIEIPQEVIDEAESTEESTTTIDENVASELSSIQDKMDDVKSYTIFMEIVTRVKDTFNDQIIDESQKSSTSDVVEDPFQIMEVQNDNGLRTEFYQSTDGTFIKLSGEDWEDITGDSDSFSESNVTYDYFAQIIFAVGKESGVEIEENEDGQLSITFTGKSVSVYEAFEVPYSLSLTGAKPIDLDHDVRITVNSETNFIESISNTMTTEVDGQKLEIELTQTYENMNEIDRIEIPQEVIDEAS